MSTWAFKAVNVRAECLHFEFLQLTRERYKRTTSVDTRLLNTWMWNLSTKIRCRFIWFYKTNMFFFLRAGKKTFISYWKEFIKRRKDFLKNKIKNLKYTNCIAINNPFQFSFRNQFHIPSYRLCSFKFLSQLIRLEKIWEKGK